MQHQHQPSNGQNHTYNTFINSTNNLHQDNTFVTAQPLTTPLETPQSGMWGHSPNQPSPSSPSTMQHPTPTHNGMNNVRNMVPSRVTSSPATQRGTGHSITNTSPSSSSRSSMASINPICNSMHHAMNPTSFVSSSSPASASAVTQGFAPSPTTSSDPKVLESVLKAREQIQAISDKDLRPWMLQYVPSLRERCAASKNENRILEQEKCYFQNVANALRVKLQEKTQHFDHLNRNFNSLRAQVQQHHVPEMEHYKRRWQETKELLDEKTKQYDQLFQQSIPQQKTTQQIINEHSWNFMNRANINGPLTPASEQSQQLAYPTAQIYPAQQSVNYGSQATSYSSNSGLSAYQQPSSTQPPERIDLTQEEAPSPNSGTCQISNHAPAPPLNTTHSLAKGHVVTYENSKEKATAGLAQARGSSESNATNLLKRKAETQEGTAAKKRVPYEWMAESWGRPDKDPHDPREIRKVIGQTNLKNFAKEEKEKEKKIAKRENKRAGKAAVDIASNAVSLAPSPESLPEELRATNQAAVGAQDVQGPMTEPAVGEEAFQAENAASGGPSAAQAPEISNSDQKTAVEREAEEALAAEMEAELEAEMEMDHDSSACQPGETADDDLDSLFGGDSVDAPAEGVEPEYGPRRKGYTGDLEIDHGDDPRRERWRELARLRARQEAQSIERENGGLPEENVAHRGATTDDAPAKKRGRPKKTMDGAKVQKSQKKQTNRKQPISMKEKYSKQAKRKSTVKKVRRSVPDGVEKPVEQHGKMESPMEGDDDQVYSGLGVDMAELTASLPEGWDEMCSEYQKNWLRNKRWDYDLTESEEE